MATVVSSSGASYHLWGLPDLSTPEPEIKIGFNTLRNDLANGYSSNVLFGSNTGLRTWTLKLPTLASLEVLPNTVTSINGESVSREQYVWDLFCECQVTGQPFVYTCPRSGQYYLVEFVDEELTFQRARVKLYSSGITLRQRRISGETVFNVALMPVASYGYDWFNETSHGSGVWTNKSPGGNNLTAAGDVVFSANPQHSLNTVRLSGSASTGVLTSPNFSAPVYELFIVMKMREAAFSNAAGIFTGSSATPTLVGTNAGTKFQNLLGATDEYYLNGTLYANTNMQSPMNTFGIVHIKSFGGGWDPLTLTQIGKDQGTAGTFAKVDIAEVVSFAQLVPTNDARELHEHLTVKWGIV